MAPVANYRLKHEVAVQEQQQGPQTAELQVAQVQQKQEEELIVNKCMTTVGDRGPTTTSVRIASHFTNKGTGLVEALQCKNEEKDDDDHKALLKRRGCGPQSN